MTSSEQWLGMHSPGPLIDHTGKTQTMNARTARLLGRIATIDQRATKRHLIRRWLRLPRPQRHEMRVFLQGKLGQA